MYAPRTSRRLAEVARKVGVSEATVSRVLNDKPGVSDGTRRVVLTALDVLGYERPTKLRGERARLVGLVLPELQNPIFPALVEVLSGGLAQNGYTPVLCTQTASGVSEADYIGLLVSQRVSGVIFAGGNDNRAQAPHEHYPRLSDRGLPTVFVNAPVDHLHFTTVSCDDGVAAELALRHLQQLGHRRIGMLLGPEDHIPSRRKLAGVEHALAAERSAPASLVIEHSTYSMQAGQAAAVRLLGRGATAMICASDPLALGAIRAVRRAGFSVPDDVSVIGYDDSALMNCTEPPLTTARQPILAAGSWVVQIIVATTAGYALSVLRPKYAGVLNGLVLATLFVPAVALLVPLYLTGLRPPLIGTSLVNTFWRSGCPRGPTPSTCCS